MLEIKIANELINIAQNLIFSTYKKTIHYNNDRPTRDKFIKEVIGGYGEDGYGNEIYRGYTSNKNRPYLKEVHKVYDTGVIIVVNPYRGMDRIVTTKIGRPGQIKGVFQMPEFVKIENKQPVLKKPKGNPPSDVIKKAIYYIQNGWNDDRNLPPESEWERIKKELKKL